MKSFVKIFAAVFIAAALVFALPPGPAFTAKAASGDKPDPSGAYIKYTVDVKKPEGETLAYNWFTMKKLDYVFEKGDLVEYDVMFNFNETGWGHIDGAITGCEATQVFRDMPGVTDQNSVRLNTSLDLSDYAYAVWYHRVIDVTENEDLIGVKWVNFQIGCYPISDELEYQCVTMYDNIVITNNGEVKLVIFKDEADWPETRISNISTSYCKAKLEMDVFSREDLDAFRAAEEAKAAEVASRAASREEANASREASREQASREASEQASIEAGIEADAKESEQEANSQAAGENGGGSPVLIIAAAGFAVIVVIIIIAVASSGKKKKK